MLKVELRGLLPLKQVADGMQETERSESISSTSNGVSGKKDCSLGTTKKGIGPTYSSKANRNGVRVSDLVGDFEAFSAKYRNLAACFKARHSALTIDEESELLKLKKMAEVIRPMVTETVTYLHDALSAGLNTETNCLLFVFSPLTASLS